MCCELPASYYQCLRRYNERKETAWRHHFEHEYALRAARRDRFKQATVELGLALKWFYGAGARTVRALGSIVRPRQEASGEVTG
jgi:hypothetical protein